MDRVQSPAWKYFTKKNDLAQCSLCPKTLTYKGGSTSGLTRHLENVHKVKPDAGDVIPSKKSKPDLSIKQFLQPNQSMEEIVSRMAALDGITINAITESSFIRESLQKRGFNLPKNVSSVKKLILSYFDTAKKQIIMDIQKIIENNGRFSVVLDEWSSIKQRRYLNTFLYGPSDNFFNLGLVYIPGKCGAIEIRTMIEQQLQEFNINFEKHIICTISDGPNVMKSFVKNSPVLGIFCLNHGIHLAVIDVLYKKREHLEMSEESDYSEYDDEFEVSSYSISPNYCEVLDNTRKIIKVFKKSPLKTASLQQYAKTELGKEVHLCSDVKTRWNSIVVMIESFLKLKNAIKKCLIDYDLAEMWNEDHIPVLKMLFEVLHPMKVAVEALSRRDCNLVIAEIILSKLFEELQNKNNSLSIKMLTSLKTRVNERRDIQIYSLIKYLHNSDDYNSKFFFYTPKSSLFIIAEEIFKRLFGDELNSGNDSSSCEEDFPVSFQDQLEKAICSTRDKVTKKRKPDNVLKKELNVYEATGNRTTNLENLYNALITIRPTSTESERVFSVAGNIATKIRNRMSDELLNALIILKFIFLQKK